MEQFEQALETLGEFAAEGNDNPRVIEAMGIATLRMPLLPTEMPPERREMVLMAGRGELHDGDAEHGGRREGVPGAGRPIPRDAERALRVRRVPAAGAAGQGDRGVQARARAAARACLVADADRVRVCEPRRRAGGAAVGEAGRGRGARTRSRRARRSGRRCSRPATSTAPSRSWRSASSSRRESPGLHFTLAQGLPARRTAGGCRAGARGVHAGSIGWRARSAAAPSLSEDDDRSYDSAARPSHSSMLLADACADLRQQQQPPPAAARRAR